MQTIAISPEDGSYGAYPISCEEGEMFSESPKRILNESDETMRFLVGNFSLLSNHHIYHMFCV